MCKIILFEVHVCTLYIFLSFFPMKRISIFIIVDIHIQSIKDLSEKDNSHISLDTRFRVPVSKVPV